MLRTIFACAFNPNTQKRSNGYLKRAKSIVLALPPEQLPTVSSFVPVPRLALPQGMTNAAFVGVTFLRS